MDFELHFPTGYQVEDINDDNLDVHVILSNDEVYTGTVFTLQNIQKLMANDGGIQFWATDMVIVKDLKFKTIELAIRELLDVEYLYSAFTKIGTRETVYKHRW